MIYILIAAFSFWFVEIARLPKAVANWLHKEKILYNTYIDGPVNETYPTRLKPFDCTLCLSFWCGLGAALAQYPWQLSPVIGGITSLMAVLMSLFTNKYLR